MKPDTLDFNKHDLKDNDWIGVVINNQDPTFAGRAQVRVFTVMDGIQDEHIPWATPVNSTLYGGNGAGNMSVPKLGQFVRIQFCNGDLYSPEITAIQNLDTTLIQTIREDYLGTHVIAFDPDFGLNIIHQPDSGLLIFYRESFFQITPDSMITIQTENADSLVQLEGDTTRIVTKNEVIVAAASKAEVTADEVVVAGANVTKVGPGPVYEDAIVSDGLIAMLKSLGTIIDAKFPPTPGATNAIIEAQKLAAKSTNVKISR